MNEKAWIENRIAALVAEHGAVPPPWFMFPNTHPYDIGWRMGDGETHVLVFASWWEAQKDRLDEAQRIEYFRQWPPPPRWLKWMIDVVWDLEPWESDDPESFDYAPYFARTEELGFGTEGEFNLDVEDPKWLII